MLNIRTLNTEDYDTILKGWWHSWNFEAPSRDFLPENGSGGYIVFDGEIPVVAGFVYQTNAKVSWASWIISNKSYRKKPQRKDALFLLVDTMSRMSKWMGYKYMYTVFKNKHLEKTFTDAGFTKTGIGYNELLKAL